MKFTFWRRRRSQSLVAVGRSRKRALAQLLNTARYHGLHLEPQTVKFADGSRDHYLRDAEANRDYRIYLERNEEEGLWAARFFY